MTIDIVFKFLKIVVNRKMGSQKRIPQARSARKETIYHYNYQFQQ